MKALKILALAALVAAPLVSFAQSNQPVTRAQVRAELVQLQQAGYNPASDETQYPANIQAALSRIEAQQNAQTATAPVTPMATTSYGGVADGVSAAGAHRRVKAAVASSVSNPLPVPDDIPGLGPIYAHS
ncbi:DUF4148 domain-containing protein [Paraburkholderia acidisoli]|uniref:DUF4148 domain-containing protein n=1 Tax=Paraburkholderia acidisoli TaxID=2571748 RepID=A0A7Z2GP46_9BURK|nr:DUF4148 domain-containing protein [Paraburkholderia acidisoli]QGZ65298.1 DUF4148 domain-containing protein [Paraburkholderia acidisoli]